MEVDNFTSIHIFKNNIVNLSWVFQPTNQMSTLQPLSLYNQPIGVTF